jgi:hypothetical protein
MNTISRCSTIFGLHKWDVWNKPFTLNITRGIGDLFSGTHSAQAQTRICQRCGIIETRSVVAEIETEHVYSLQLIHEACYEIACAANELIKQGVAPIIATSLPDALEKVLEQHPETDNKSLYLGFLHQIMK